MDTHDNGAVKMKSIQLPPRTREILEKALHERQMLQSLMQQNQQRIDDVVLAAREMLAVPDGWRLENLAAGFVPPPDADDDV